MIVIHVCILFLDLNFTKILKIDAYFFNLPKLIIYSNELTVPNVWAEIKMTQSNCERRKLLQTSTIHICVKLADDENEQTKGLISFPDQLKKGRMWHLARQIEHIVVIAILNVLHLLNGYDYYYSRAEFA